MSAARLHPPALAVRGTLPNTKQDLLAWIADPQSIKPGNKMPQVPLDRSELDALIVELVAFVRERS